MVIVLDNNGIRLFILVGSTLKSYASLQLLCMGNNGGLFMSRCASFLGLLTY